MNSKALIAKLLVICLACSIAGVSSASAAPHKLYVCPACGCADDGRTFDKPGVCPSCGMKLIEKVDNPQKQQQVSVAVLLFDGVEIIDYAGPWEVFGQAGFKIFTVAENAKPIDAVFGQKLIPDYAFADAPRSDVVLVPGGGGSRQAMENPAVLKWLQQSAQRSEHVISVCTGALILAKAGLLDGLTATTFHSALDLLAQAAPKTRVVNDQRYVDNGKIITTAGLSSGIDGALYLVSKMKSKGFAQATALTLEYRWEPDSKYARAALADRYFPQIDDFDGEISSTDGDTSHWRLQAIISKPDSAKVILDLISKRVVNETPHARGAVTLASSGKAENGGGEIGWKFVDDKSNHWNGRAVVEPASSQRGKFNLILTLEREEKSI